jgi:hypothetical protein
VAEGSLAGGSVGNVLGVGALLGTPSKSDEVELVLRLNSGELVSTVLSGSELCSKYSGCELAVSTPPMVGGSVTSFEGVAGSAGREASS